MNKCDNIVKVRCPVLTGAAGLSFPLQQTLHRRLNSRNTHPQNLIDRRTIETCLPDGLKLRHGLFSRTAFF